MENTESKDNSGQKTVKRVIKKRIISDAAGAYGGYGYGLLKGPTALSATT